jgi:hypothetical protein
MEAAIIFLYIIALVIITLLLYSLFNKSQPIMIYNEVPPAVIQTHHWGFAWRPWWRRFTGIPGFEPTKPISKPTIPNPPKPIIIPK